jgi:uncharacterized protein with HEPN domain
MQRQSEVYLEDILSAIRKIEKFTEGLSFEEFRKNELVSDAVARNLEIIGEAVKRIPENEKSRQPLIEWKKLRA